MGIFFFFKILFLQVAQYLSKMHDNYLQKSEDWNHGYEARRQDRTKRTNVSVAKKKDPMLVTRGYRQN